MGSNDTFSILIADNDEVYADILGRIVKPYNTIMATSGWDAVQMAREFVPDLILLEVSLPDISGFEVFAELKRHASTKKIPVIFLTGLNNTEDEEKVLFLGAVDFITKPFHNPVISTKIRMHLQFIKQARIIEEQISIDPLTGLPNRHGYEDRLFLEWGRAVREKTHVSLLLINIDRFASYRSTYGRPQGDVLVQAIVEVITHSIKRATDFVARLGSDEFAIILPSTNLKGAYKVAEVIRANVEDTAVPCVDKPDTFVTVSIGINSISPTSNDLTNEYIKAAGTALKMAKEKGGNTFFSQAELI